MKFSGEAYFLNPDAKEEWQKTRHFDVSLGRMGQEELKGRAS